MSDITPKKNSPIVSRLIRPSDQASLGEKRKRSARSSLPSSPIRPSPSLRAPLTSTSSPLRSSPAKLKRARSLCAPTPHRSSPLPPASQASLQRSTSLAVGPSSSSSSSSQLKRRPSLKASYSSLEVIGKTLTAEFLPKSSPAPSPTPSRSSSLSLSSSKPLERTSSHLTAQSLPEGQFRMSTPTTDASRTPRDAQAAEYIQSISEACGLPQGQRILSLATAAPAPSRSTERDVRSLYGHSTAAPKALPATARRPIRASPERSLDAPGLTDDFYLNLLDWSSEDMIAVALGRSTYLWDSVKGDVIHLADSPEGSSITSLRWSDDGLYLALGLSDASIQLWDVESKKKLRSMLGHSSRVSSLAWNEHLLSSGCLDGSIWNHDVRLPSHKTAELLGHTSEVCGLVWRDDGAQLASGGNDNLVNIWDARSRQPKYSKAHHSAAVKALAWCPWQTNLLASGGGSSDRRIQFWNTSNGANLGTIDTGSQVTALTWNQEHRELLSAHGAPRNHLSLWNYPALTKIIDIPAHDSRVLQMATSPDRSMVATAASDESLRIWFLWDLKSSSASSSASKRAHPTIHGPSLTRPRSLVR
ncbi:MAG: WD40-repeat-containing domain protein [Piptocephalis tieghemiana]|nr:MAG: WD40-repeat-containing domain protein [Piptocephalis tieghemiana]